jgi:hypothetical protein
MNMRDNSMHEAVRFPDIVSEHFRFLQDEFAYELVYSSAHCIEYRSVSLIGRVTYDPYSYDVEFDIALRNETTSEWYSLGEMLESSASEYRGQRAFQARNNEILELCIKTIANLVRTYCKDLLFGRRHAIEALVATANSMREHTTHEYAIRPVKEAASEAWQQKNYRDVIRLYESIASHLDEVEKQKLAYARKRMQK